MGLKRETLERQLSLASTELDACSKKLDEKGVDANVRRRNPVWRSLNAKCRTIRHRLAAVNAIADREAECVRRKEEKASSDA